MQLLVTIALFLGVVLIPVLMTQLPPHRVLIYAFVIGWLFMPEIQTAPVNPEGQAYEMPGLRFTKINCLVYGSLAGILLFDLRRVLAFRPAWYDLPMAIWTVVPVFSSLTNLDPVVPGEVLGIVNGFSQAREVGLSWAVPYFIGRLYFGDPGRFREMTLAVVVGGLVYVPFCMAEVMLSTPFTPNREPFLHKLVYGFQQHEVDQVIRFGGLRPVAFMQHGLAVGMYLAAAALFAVWLWWTGAVKKLPVGRGIEVPMLVLAVVLPAVAFASKSFGALALGIGGLAILATCRFIPVPAGVVLLLAVPFVYFGVRTSGVWTGQDLIDSVAEGVEKERAQSLGFRFKNENLLSARALQRPWFGWGGWGRNQIYDAYGKQTTIADGLWILVLGDYGFVGLISLWAAMLLPAARLVGRVAPAKWGDPRFAPAAVTGVFLGLFMIDNLSNAMFNPVFVILAGGLSGVVGPLTAAAAPRPLRTSDPATASGASGRPVVSPRPRSHGPEPARPGVLRRRLPS